MQSNLLSAMFNTEKNLNNCGKKLVLYSDGGNLEIINDCPVKYFEDEKFDTITAITFSSSIKTALQLVRRFKEINLYIGLPEDYYKTVDGIVKILDEEENKEIAEEIVKETDKKISIYSINNSHIKIYFLTNTGNPLIKRVILSSANLSEIALKGNQIEHFIIFDDETKYDEIYTFFETKIKPYAKLIVDNKKKEKIVKDLLKKEEDLVIALVKDLKDLSEDKIDKIIDTNELLQNEKAMEKVISKLIEDEETRKVIMTEAIKNEETREILVDKLKKEIQVEQMVNIAKDPNHLQNAISILENISNEDSIKKLRDNKKTLAYLLKKKNIPEAKLKNEIRILLPSNKEQPAEGLKAFYTYDEERNRFNIKGLDDVKYDIDIVKRDVETLNRFISAYSTIDGEFKQERFWIVSAVLLYGFSSFYISFLRYNFKRYRGESHDVAPTFCLLVGASNSGKTLLLTLLSKLFGKEIERYSNIVSRNNKSREAIIIYYLTKLKEIAPLLIDEVKPSDIRDNKNFGDAIKSYSNDPFGNSDSYIPQGNIFLTANLEELTPENQIVRRVLFFYFKASVKDSREFRQKITATGFNSLTSEIARYYVYWLNENMDKINNRLSEILSKENPNIKDTFSVAYDFLQSIGVNVSMDFPDSFGSYEYFIRSFWRNWYFHHGKDMFIEKNDKIFVNKEKVYEFIKPSQYFEIVEASTPDMYVFDKKKFLEFIDLEVKIDKKYITSEEDKNKDSGYIEKIGRKIMNIFKIK